MKILCTSDWHLGKKTENKSRLDEQRAVLECMLSVVDSEGIDVALVAGDVFDTFVPSSEAEELFYEYACKFGSRCLFVVLAGNHDDASRLCAPDVLARSCNIVMVSDDVKPYVKGGLEVRRNGLVYKKNGQELRLAFLPYPTDSSLELKDGDSYEEKVAQKIKKCSEIFDTGCINVFVSHLFMSGATTTNNDERELGSAKLLSKDILPDGCFTILGHIHKPMVVSHSKNAYYSGSIMPYSFDDDTQKRVIVYESDGVTESKKDVLLSGYKKCVKITASSFDEACEKVQSATDLVELHYNGEEALLPSMYATLRRMPNFAKIVLERSVNMTKRVRKDMSTKEVFESFYEKRKGVKPQEIVTQTFLSYMAKTEEGV